MSSENVHQDELRPEDLAELTLDTSDGLMELEAKVMPVLLEKYTKLFEQDADAQAEHFLKSFIFGLGDEWTQVNKLAKEWKIELKATKATGNTLDEAQFNGLRQKVGRPHTAQQTRQEVREIDVVRDGSLHFLHFLILYYKPMILKDYYKRMELDPAEDLNSEFITGVGYKLVDETMTMPFGLSPALEEAIEKFAEEKKAREQKIKDLEAKVAMGGVKGKAAQNELDQMTASDSTAMNRLEVTLAAAKRTAAKKNGEEMLAKMREKQEKEEAAKKAQGRAKMHALAAKFGGAV